MIDCIRGGERGGADLETPKRKKFTSKGELDWEPMQKKETREGPTHL